MKAIIILSIMFAFTSNFVMSQPVRHINGGHYLKTVEYNVIHLGKTEESNIYPISKIVSLYQFI